MKMNSFQKLALFAALAVSVSACGGGGAGGTSTSVVPTQPSPLPTATASALSVAFVVNASSISPGTGSIRIAVQSVNGVSTVTGPVTIAKIASGASGCATDPQKGLTCTIAAAATSGVDVFGISTYQSSDGSGTALATATVSANVSAGSTQSVPLSLGGVPARVVFSPSKLPLIADGVIHRFPVTLNVADASGATIVGTASYQSPVSLQVMNDPAHALSMSTSSVSKPGDVVTITYDASKPLVQAQIVASDNAMTPGTLVAAPLTVNPTPLAIFDDAAPGTITLSEAGFTGAFSASVTNANDASVTVGSGTLNSGSAVLSVVPKVRFDTTTLNVSDGNMTYGVPLAVVPHNSAYTAFGGQHTMLIPSLNMVQSPDGKLWTGDQEDGTLVAFDPSTGNYSKFVVDPSLSGPQSVAVDSNGNVWFADGLRIGKFTPSTSGTTFYSTGLQASPRITTIVAGAGGASMWFFDWAANNAVSFGHPTFFGTIDTSTGTIQEYPANNAQSDRTTLLSGVFMSMAVAADNSLWFSDGYNYSVGHMSPTGNIQEYKLTSPSYPQQSPSQIAITPDGKVWAACFGSAGNSVIASLDPNNGNAIAYYTTGLNGGMFTAFTRGSDGNLWFILDPFAGFGFSLQTNLGVLNPATGAIYQYPDSAIPNDAKVTSILDRGDGALWMLDNGFGQIGKVTFK